MIDTNRLQEIAESLHRAGRLRDGNEVMRAAAAIESVNAHRARADRAAEKAMLGLRAISWLRRRVRFLERAIVEQKSQGVFGECELCGTPIDISEPLAPACGRCIAERSA